MYFRNSLLNKNYAYQKAVTVFHQAQKSNMKILLLSLFVIINCFITTESCTCTTTSQLEQYLSDPLNYPYVAVVKILNKVVNTGQFDDDLLRYRVQVITSIKGCLPNVKCPIILETKNSSGECGRPLDNEFGKLYVISFSNGSTSCKNSYAFGLCDYFALSSDLEGTDDMWLLNNWKNDCLGVCATGIEIQCVVAPCDTATPPDGCDTYQKVCTDNYCNGCNAIWWNDNGTILCHSTPVPQK